MKKKIYLIFLLYLTFIILSGCKSLTRSQIRACNKYFDALRNYNLYANELNNHVADVKINGKKLHASTIDSVEFMIELIDSSIFIYQKDILMPFELKNALVQTKRYVGGYSFKASYNTDFLRNLKSFMITYIPIVGAVVYEILYTTRNILIKPYVLYREGKKIKLYISNGNDIISNSSKIIQDYSGIYLVNLEIEEKLLKEHYILFVADLHQAPDSWDKYNNLNPIFFHHLNELIYSKQMAEHLILASDYLNNSQDTLYQLTRKRKRIKDGIPELSGFAIETGYLKKISDELEKFD